MRQNLANAVARRRQGGMTLVELMVAVTIGLILLAGVIQIFSSSKQLYRVQEATSRLQENGRYAMNLLSREIRMAGFWGCGSTGADVEVTIDMTKPDAANLPSPNSNGGIDGADGAGGAPDSITLSGAFGTGIWVYSHNVSAASLDVPTGNGLEVGDAILICDGSHITYSQISGPTNPSTAGNMVVNTGSSVSPGNTSKTAYQFVPPAEVYKTQKVTYSIQNDTSGQPALFVTDKGVDQELVEGVEDMQILYGEDTNADQTADRYVPAGTAGLNMENVVSVRVTLTLQTVEDNVALTTANGDKRIRKNFTSTITLRNRAG